MRTDNGELGKPSAGATRFEVVRAARALFMVLAISATSPVLHAASADEYRAAVAAAALRGFNGVALVGSGRRVDAIEAAGLADADGVANVPIRAETRFETGSVSKWIASIVVMALVDRGALALDAPIRAYLPYYRVDTGSQLTLRHLMSHSSGVPNQIVAALRADRAAALVELPQDEAVRRYASGDLAFAPGSAWDYSHSNWLIVKAIVERASGRSYTALVGEILVTPLGLRDSGVFRGDSALVDGMAKGYSTLLPSPVRRIGALPDHMAMAGGFYTTAGDLFRLMAGVLDGPVLSPAARRTLMSVAMPEQHYALGGRTRVERIAGLDREAAWEDGSNGGFRLVARRVLADGHTVILFNNSSWDHQALGDLADALMEASYR